MLNIIIFYFLKAPTTTCSDTEDKKEGSGINVCTHRSPVFIISRQKGEKISPLSLSQRARLDRKSIIIGRCSSAAAAPDVT